MKAVIVTNGDLKDYKNLKTLFDYDDIIICADGAIRHCLGMDIIPNHWIGDFDSCSLKYYLDQYPYLKNIKIHKLNPEKDLTDTQAACDIAIQAKCDEVVILGGFGSRIDHSLSNIFLLEYLLIKGVKSSLVNDKNKISIFKDTIKITKTKKYLSLLAFDKDVTVVKTDGLKYPLKNYVLKRHLSLGVSNEIISQNATITISDGLAVVIESDD